MIDIIHTIYDIFYINQKVKSSYSSLFIEPLASHPIVTRVVLCTLVSAVLSRIIAVDICHFHVVRTDKIGNKRHTVRGIFRAARVDLWRLRKTVQRVA